MANILGAAATAVAIALLAGNAEAQDVGAMAEVLRTVYGVPPQGSELVKRKGDVVVFQEALQTVDRSGALIRFIDDSTLALGANSKVLIDAFVFDPQKAEGNALIRISVGTLRFVTGEMPKGKTVIKTPVATLVLRGTDVTVHVHPDGTTDATVNEGSVDGNNDVTGQAASIMAGQGATFGEGGNSDFSGDSAPVGGGGGGNGGGGPEQRRGSSEPNNHGSQSPGGGGGYGPAN